MAAAHQHSDRGQLHGVTGNRVPGGVLVEDPQDRAEVADLQPFDILGCGGRGVADHVAGDLVGPGGSGAGAEHAHHVAEDPVVAQDRVGGAAEDNANDVVQTRIRRRARQRVGELLERSVRTDRVTGDGGPVGVPERDAEPVALNGVGARAATDRQAWHRTLGLDSDRVANQIRHGSGRVRPYDVAPHDHPGGSARDRRDLDADHRVGDDVAGDRHARDRAAGGRDLDPGHQPGVPEAGDVRPRTGAVGLQAEPVPAHHRAVAAAGDADAGPEVQQCRLGGRRRGRRLTVDGIQRGGRRRRVAAIGDHVTRRGAGATDRRVGGRDLDADAVWSVGIATPARVRAQPVTCHRIAARALQRDPSAREARDDQALDRAGAPRTRRPLAPLPAPAPSSLTPG